MKMYDLRSLRVLVVDDNAHMRNLVMTILHAFGVKQVEQASDGADALQYMTTINFDLIIADWMMEPLDGLDFTRLIRTGSDSKNPYVPIILMTGHTDLESVIEARDAGVNEILAKPISAKTLYDRIVSIIERPRPFIRTKTYCGPCRRRRKDPNYRGRERRRNPDETTIVA